MLNVKSVVIFYPVVMVIINYQLINLTDSHSPRKYKNMFSRSSRKKKTPRPKMHRAPVSLEDQSTGDHRLANLTLVAFSAAISSARQLDRNRQKSTLREESTSFRKDGRFFDGECH